jgi:hypothetical protein
LAPCVEFVQKTNLDKYYPNQEIMKLSIGFIGDICDIYKKETKQILNLEVIGNIIGKLRSINESRKSNQLTMLLDWAERVIIFTYLIKIIKMHCL